MITNVTQRWRAHRASYRPAGELFNPHAHEVALIADDNPAKAFVVAHHYSESYPAARLRAGLYERVSGELVGVAVLAQPMRDEVLRDLPGAKEEKAELGRFVLLDRVKANGESWFIARVRDLASREGYVSILAASDPCVRVNAAGESVFPGHIGLIYQASSAVYLGRGGRRTLRLLPDGKVMSARSISKIRARERGWRYSAAILERYGAPSLGERDDARAWLTEWLPRLTRAFRHGGHHRYAIGLDRAAKRVLERKRHELEKGGVRYPKLILAPRDAR